MAIASSAEAKSIALDANKSGAWLVRYALEQLPISFTFGIPGVHNTEIYDELNMSSKIQPVLVTHEAGAGFIADAISRTGNGQIGCLLIVPAAGVTHAMSGIGEAFLDGIPMLILTGGTRTDIPYGHQLHELDQVKLVKELTKGAWKVERHEDIVPTIFEAYRVATGGTPGPVLVELPVNVQLFRQKVTDVPRYVAEAALPADAGLIDRAADLLISAQSPGIFLGWGAVDVAKEMEEIADLLGAPVSTTLQGLSAFRATHPLHTGMSFSGAAVPAATNAFKDCDALLAVGTRFGEIGTASYGISVPSNLVHIDINSEVIGRNYPANVGITADARAAIPLLLDALKKKALNNGARRQRVSAQIAKDKAAYREEWRTHVNERVNPQMFFEELRKQLRDDAITVVDDGNHTFLAAELFPVVAPRGFISDFR